MPFALVLCSGSYHSGNDMRVDLRFILWIYISRVGDVEERSSSAFPRISYRSGSEHSPVDPFGMCLLEVAPDGVVRLTNLRRGNTRRWEGRLDPRVSIELQ